MPDRDDPLGRRRQRRRTAKEHGPDPIDRRVGEQLRQARELAGLTQVNVGTAIAMSFQVVQKYEQGEIRVSASRLFQLAKLFDKPLHYFFATASDEAAVVDGAFVRPEIELIRAFRAIANVDIRQRLLLFVRSMSGPRPAETGPPADSPFGMKS